MTQILGHNPATVHPPAGGYCMGLELKQHRRLLFISGQVPERSDGTVPEGFEAQCEQAWRNVKEVLAAGRPWRRASGQGHHVPDRLGAARG